LTRPLVVLQLISNLRIGGAQRVVVSLCNELVASGQQVVLVTLGEGGPLAAALRPSRLLTVRHLHLRRHSLFLFPLFLWSVARILWRLRRIMREHRVDVVHSHAGDSNLLGMLAARLAGVPRRFATFHSLVFLARGRPDDLRNRLARRTLRAYGRIATKFVAISDAVRDEVIAVTGIAPERVVTVRNGIEIPPPADAALREPRRLGLGLDPGDRVVLCVGRLTRAKGHPHLLRALALLAGDFPRLVCLLIGDGDERAPLEALAAELKIEKRVRFLGYRSDVAELYSIGDAFVLPSEWEGLPISLLEAMAAGLPCVATRIAGTAEVIRDGNGLLVPPQDPPALAAALRRILEDPEGAALMSEQGRRDVVARHGMERVCASYLELYRGEEPCGLPASTSS
jgi:glycosyltransferase involved in cell wall biosynthesis